MNQIVIFFLLSVGLFLSFYLGFFSIRKTGTALKHILKKEEGTSVFESLSVSLAATMGIGNIVGVSFAILLGGYGAIFWMWITAILGSILQFSEAALTIKHQKKIMNQWVGGPMFYMEQAVKKKIFRPLPYIYASTLVLGSFLLGNMIQSNSISYSIQKGNQIVGIVLTLIIFLSIIGGIKNIGDLLSIIIPFLTLLYFSLSIIVIIRNGNFFESFALIIEDAFTGKSIGTGFLFGALKVGISKGVFTNEAGLESGAVPYGSSRNKPAYQVGLVASLGVFFDTIIMCSLTALVIITSRVIQFDSGGKIINGNQFLTLMAFTKSLGIVGAYFIQASIVVFGIATIIGWFAIGYSAFIFLFKGRFIWAYKVIYVALVYFGVTFSITNLWIVGDFINSILASINLCFLLFLRKEVKKIIKKKE